MGLLGALVRVVCVVGGGIVAVAVYKRYDIGRRIKKVLREVDRSDERTGKKTYTETPPVSQPFDREKAKMEFVKKSFEGIYESIYRVAQGTSINPDDVIADWDTRINYLDSCPNLRNFWRSLFANYESFTAEQLKETASNFIKFVFETGIKRDSGGQVTIDGTTRYKYYTANDEEFVIDETMKVKFACWSFGDKILEKGILIP